MGLEEARAFAESHGHHVTLVIGVAANHDSQWAQEILDDMLARVMTMRDMPLLPNAISDDCLVGPPERGNVHLELRWISI